MITPAPQVNKTFDPPLAARPMPIRTGSLSPPPSPALNRVRRGRLRQATSMLGMRSLQGFSHLRSLTTLPQKARDRSDSHSGSSRSIASRKGLRERPLVIGRPILQDVEGPHAVLQRRIVVAGRPDDEQPVSPLPALEPRVSAVCSPFLDANTLEKLQAPMADPALEAESTQLGARRQSHIASWVGDTYDSRVHGYEEPCSPAKRIGGVELWETLDIDHDALCDALMDHPDPLSSNPTSERDDDEPTTPWTTVSSTIGEPEAPDAMVSYWQPSRSPSPAPRRRHRSTTLAATPAHDCTAEPASMLSSPLNRQQCACDTIPGLRNQLTNVSVCNSALLTLKAAHEETIAILRNNIQHQDTTISRHENTIADLTWQAQAKETEKVSIIENLCAEIANESREISKLGEDKWYLMGRVEELELKVATIEDPVVHEGQGPVKLHEATVHGSMPTVANDMTPETFGGDAGNATSPGLVASPLTFSSSQTLDLTASSNDNVDTPSTTLSSLSSPRLNRSLYAATPTKSVRPAPCICTSKHDVGHSCLLTSPPRDNIPFRLINALGARDVSSVSDQQTHQARDGRISAAQAVLGAKVMLDQRLVGTQEKLATFEAQNVELQAQVAGQARLIQQFTRTPTAALPALPAHTSIPDLPILKYTTSATVWLDRVQSSFAYLGLLDFIQRDVPQPELSTWDAAEVTDWTSRRLRAVVLLKKAVDDDILEDVLYLHGRNETAPSERNIIQSNGPMDDPHRLLGAIITLRRIISATATDLSWLDRIQSSDVDGIESFTSLVLCVDKRHGVLYGTSADHYDALLQKLQETMARLFPELKGSMFAEDSDSGLRKWRQLPIWMAKVVKRRQTG